MKWVTRSHVHVDRVACPWLIRRFVDSEAEFIFVPRTRVSEVVEQRRSTQRYQPRGKEAEERLVKRMLELVGDHPRYGSRRIWALLRFEVTPPPKKELASLGR